MELPTHIASVQPILSVRNLRTEFRTRAGVAVAVDDVSFDVRRGEILGIVGESGSGKSVTSLSIMGLVPSPPGRVTEGEVLLNGKDLRRMSPREIQQLRGNRISMIFQEPMTSLNPVLTIGRQMTEGIEIHTGRSGADAHAHAVEMLRKVNIPAPEARMNDYPHQLSGGMLQRVMIGIAMACEPELLIADEPTTALDVTVQAQILDLMRDMRDTSGTAIILITHDMGVVAETASRVIVMYSGRKVEEATVRELFANPRHPYTRGLLGAIPKLGNAEDVGATMLAEIPGIVPALTNLPTGCYFRERCERQTERCAAAYPDYEEVSKGHLVACWEWRAIREEDAV